MIVDTLVNFICVWLNFKFSSTTYEFLCECRCKYCTRCDFHGCIKKWYFQRNGFVYESTTDVSKSTKLRINDETAESNENITNRDGRSHAILVSNNSLHSKQKHL